MEKRTIKISIVKISQRGMLLFVKSIPLFLHGKGTEFHLKRNRDLWARNNFLHLELFTITLADCISLFYTFAAAKSGYKF